MTFKLKVAGILILLLFSSINTYAQSDLDPEINQIIELLDRNSDAELDYSELIDRLMTYKSNPINLNSASVDELMNLWFLTPLQINSIRSHIQENGPFLDVLELQAVPNLDIQSVKLLLPFVSIKTPNPFHDLNFRKLVFGHHDLLLRYEQLFQNQAGYSDLESGFTGTPQHIVVRYRYQYNQHLSGALNLEKDPGETMFRNRIGMFDFGSGHLFVKNYGIFKKIVIGDYDLQFGQGMALWSGLGFGKSALLTSIAKSAIGLKPYSSLNEGMFFRGIASTLAWKKIQITPFYSNRKLDASLSANGEVTSISTSGLHRTPTELINRRNLNQIVFGAAIQYSHKSLTVGLTSYHTQFGKRFEPGLDPYNQFDFQGKQLTSIGLNYQYTFRNSYVFGEFAKSSEGDLASVNGIISSLSPKLSVALLYRAIPVNFLSFYNSVFAESSTGVNERGFYSGICLKPNSKWELSLYTDVFQFPWLKYGVDAPSRGHELAVKLNYKPSKHVELIGQYRIKYKEENETGENTFNDVIETKHQRFRLDLAYDITKDIQARNRYELVKYQTENAHLIYQDISYQPLQSRFSGNIRFAVFNIPSYDSRIYAFQNDVLFSNSILAYQNQGMQFYVNARYRFARALDLWLHYETQSYANRESIGSGTTQIVGNKRSEVKLQLRYQF